MMYYTITSDERLMFKKPSVLEQIETRFLRLYHYYMDSEQLEEAYKYLKYFNHVAAMRNRLEYGI